MNACSVTAALQFIPADKTGVGSGASLMMRWLGGAVGAAVMSTVFMMISKGQMQQAIASDEAYHRALSISMLI